MFFTFFHGKVTTRSHYHLRCCDTRINPFTRGGSTVHLVCNSSNISLSHTKQINISPDKFPTGAVLCGGWWSKGAVKYKKKTKKTIHIQIQTKNPNETSLNLI